jgi:flagellar hook protein FlgE
MALTALFVGASGLTANSTALDVVGNNLANINTTGYKNQRTLFRDTVYQTLSAGSGSVANVGGTNPQQIGFGVGIQSIDTQFQQGNLNPTGRSLDAGIQGDGFFVLSDGTKNVFSRAGSFSVDSQGYLIDPSSGFRVQRFGAVGEGTGPGTGFQVAGDNRIKVPFGTGMAGVPTTTVNLRGNLSADTGGFPVGTTARQQATIQVYDSLSGPQTLNLTFTKTATNQFTVAGTITGGGTVAVPATPITFDTSGNLTSPATLPVTVTGIPGASAQTITLNLGTVGRSDGLSGRGEATTVSAITQDGSASGTLTGVSYDQDGTVQGVFSNGRTTPLAQLAIAGFNNQGGLLRQGQNYFVTSAASGEALIGPAASGGRGTVVGGTLEGANVDIAIEFSRLIVAQRGFQVNARTITAANETLQELANIIR